MAKEGKLKVLEPRNLKRLIVVGDLHGDYAAFNSLLNLANPSRDCILFLGDYADRGLNGMEVIEGIDSLLKKYSANVVALKGNHESYTESGIPTFSPCDLMYEVREKGKDWDAYFEKELKPFIGKLYLAAVLPDEILFVHGGVSRKIRSLRDLEKPSREIEIDVLWSDPFEGYGERPNWRGAGVEFGRDVSEEVCKKLGVKKIIRSHQPRKAMFGPFEEHEGRVITISSTSVYGGKPFVLLIDPKKPSELSTHFL